MHADRLSLADEDAYRQYVAAGVPLSPVCAARLFDELDALRAARKPADFRDDRNAIRARREAISPPPWTAERDALGHWIIRWAHSENSSVLRNGKLFSDEDIAFIVRAPDDIDALLALAEQLQAERDEAAAILRDALRIDVDADEWVLRVQAYLRRKRG